MTFGRSVAHGFRHLLTLSGRNARSAFWPFAAVAFGLTQVAGLIFVAPFFVEAFARTQRFAVEHPDQVAVQQGPGTYSMLINGAHPELMPDPHGFFGVIAATASVFVVLIAAAVVRRLHDTGRSGWWGAMPLPFIALALSLFGKLFAGMSTGDPDLALFALLFLNNLVYLGTIVTLVVLLARAGQAGENRFEPAPA